MSAPQEAAGNGGDVADMIPEATERDELLPSQVSLRQGCAPVHPVFGFVQVCSLLKR